jgi:hypothetical protein
MVPLFKNDTLGGDDAALYGIKPIPIVVIAHVADPRWLQCYAANATSCRNKLVVDRVAWIDGEPSTPSPEFFDPSDYSVLVTQHSWDQMEAVIGSTATLVSAIATTADGVRAVDPRWNLTGRKIYWVIRSVAASADAAAGDDPTREVTVSLVDDANGEVIDRVPLELPSGYEPARLWVTETRQHVDWNSEQTTGAFYSVAALNGEVMQDGAVGGGESGSGNNIVDGPDLPLILAPGTYTLTAWLGTRDLGGTQSPQPTSLRIGECSTQHTFAAGDDVLLNATYVEHGACVWSSGARPSFGYP